MMRKTGLWQTFIRVLRGEDRVDEARAADLDEDVERALGGEVYSEEEAGAPEVREKVDPRTLYEVNEALRQWKEATTYFESVSDPDLVDFAIYDMEASRRRYVYLVKRTRGDRYNHADPQMGSYLSANQS